MRYDHIKSDGRTVSFDTVTGARLRKYEITLANRAGEIDRQVIELLEGSESWQLTHYVAEAIKCWALADGDVIRILEQK
jgi:hypothetical protein